MGPLYHFYHIWVGGFWQPIVTDHFNSLIQSGLAQKLEKIYIGLVGCQENRQLAKTLLTGFNIEYEICIEADSGYEQVTLNVLHDFSLHNDGCVLYAHNKGSWHKTQLNDLWRQSMTYFNIAQWISAVDKLKLVDAVGCHWIVHNHDSSLPSTPFFGGTFWWSHLSYLRTLCKPLNNTRFDAEHWIGLNENIRVYDLCPGWPNINIFHSL